MSAITAGYDMCPSWAALFGYLGASVCMVASSWGSAWGTWKAGLGLCKMGTEHPKGVMKGIVPIVMAGVLGIYGLIVSVIIVQSLSIPKQEGNTYSMFNGYVHLAAGLTCGLSCLVAGGVIGLVGDAGLNGYGLKIERGRKWFYGEDGPETTMGEKDGEAKGEERIIGGTPEQAVIDANKIYVGTLIMLIFGEALALYGLIVALILTQHNYVCQV